VGNADRLGDAVGPLAFTRSGVGGPRRPRRPPPRSDRLPAEDVPLLGGDVVRFGDLGPEVVGMGLDSIVALEDLGTDVRAPLRLTDAFAELALLI
jgi:hypothetical protein